LRRNRRVVFPLVYWTLLILCFFVFPIFLLNLAADRYFSMIQNEQENSELLKAQKILARLRWQSAGSRYFHQLFKEVFARPVAAETVASALTQRIARLKKAFPDELSFIVWDRNGKLVEELSDDKSFVIVKNRLDTYLKELQQITVASFPGAPLLTGEIKKRVRKFRQLLGPFISSAKIAEAFVPNNQAKCFQMNVKGRQAYGWYAAQSEFSVFIYISHRLINSMIYPMAFCQKYAYKKAPMNFFLINEKTFQVFPETSWNNAVQLAINLKKTASLTPPELLKSDNSFYAFQKLESDWWAAAVIDTGRFADAQTQNRKLMFRLLAAIFISFFILQCYFLVHSNPFNSLRWKLFVIFLYTVAIPLMIFSTVGFEHLAQMEKGIENRRGIQLVQLLSKVDHQFGAYLLKKSESLSKFIEAEFWNISSQDPVPADPAGLAGRIRQKFRSHTIIMMDEKGNNLLPRVFSGQMADHAIVKAVAIDLLAFLNDRELAQIKPVKLVTEASLLSYAHSNREIRVFNLADATSYYFQQTIRSPKTGRYEYCVQMFWDVEDLQIDFFRQFAQRLKVDQQLLPVMFLPESSYAIPENSLWEDLTGFFEMVDLRGLQLERYVSRSDKKFLIAGIRGQKLLKSVTAVLLDFAAIKDEVDQHKVALAGLLMLTLLFTVALYNLLNYQILNPVNRLIAGVEKVRFGDYAYRIALRTDNELGSLATSIDKTMENLQELAIAKTVQEALLPENTPELAGFEIYAKTCPMTKLGGDYYDYFVNHDGRLVAMIADVAGHGAQAALIMAMAKSVLLLARNESIACEQMMERLNETLVSLRKSAINTMLTGQMLTLFSSQKKCNLVNAGHCPPIIVSADGREVKAMKCQSFPLGYGKNRKFTSATFELEHRSILILYTDGILESINSANQMLGPEGFLELIKESFNKDLATFYDNMFARYEKWRVSQNDDITFVLIRRTSDEN